VLKLKYHKGNLLLGSANNGVRWQGKNKGDIPVIALLQLHYAEMKLNFFLYLCSRVVAQNFSQQRRRNLLRAQTIRAAMLVGSHSYFPKFYLAD